MKYRLTRKFIKHVAVTDLFVFLALFCYDILAWLIPVVRVRFWGGYSYPADCGPRPH